jgi:galactonate dehydratase
MRITSLETLHADGGRRAFDFVKVTTDDGLVGWSEYNETFGGSGLTALIRRLAPALVGKDPRAHEAHVALMQALRRTSAGGVVQQAIGAIENALLDVKARAFGIPVYELLGGPVREKVRAYTHVRRPGALEAGGRVNMWWGEGTPEASAAMARELVGRGFTALKTGPFVEHGTRRDRAWLDRTVARAMAIREAVGPGIDLMLDLHGRLEVPDAVRFAEAVEPVNLYFLEEPVPPDSLEALARVARKTRVPLAVGERLYSRHDAWQVLKLGAVDFLQPDVCHAGGITETRAIAALAEVAQVRIAPHNPLGPVATAAALHVAASIPNFALLEMKVDDVPWRNELLTRPILPVDGYFALPTGPGLGIEVNWDCVRAHPYRAQDLPRTLHEDGSVAIW